MKYQRKPFEVDAMQYTGNNLAEISLFVHAKVETAMLPGPAGGVSRGISITMVQGQEHLIVAEGWWIVKSYTGEISKLDPKTFESTYVPVLIPS